MLTGSLKYLIEFKENQKRLTIGSHELNDIVINGISIMPTHAVIKFKHNEFWLNPFDSNSRLLINGKQIEKRNKLNNFDRIVLGASSFFLFIDPRKFGNDNIDKINDRINSFKIEQIQQELAAEELGIVKDEIKEKNPEEIACYNELIDIMPLIEVINS